MLQQPVHLCGTEDEDLCHFILVCTKLSRIRKRHLQNIEDYWEKIHKGFCIRNVNENALLQVIIDCTSNSINYMRRIRSKNYTELEVLTRNFCSDLHRSRMRQMAGLGIVIVWTSIHRILQSEYELFYILILLKNSLNGYGVRSVVKYKIHFIS